MRYRELGKTGLTFSELGFGTIPILRGPKDILPRYYNLTEASATRLLLEAYESGITFYDTAVVPEYGDAEAKLGIAMQGIREKVTLASKSRSFTKDSMQSAVESSLRNLKTDYIDIYFIHQLKPALADKAIRGDEGALAALIKAKQDGKIREIGVGTHYATVAAKALAHPAISVVQLPYNVLESGIYQTVAEQVPDASSRLVFHKVLAGGVLTSHFPLNYLLSCALRRSPLSLLLGIGTPYQLRAALAEYDKCSSVDVCATFERLEDAFVCDRCQKCICSNGQDIPHTLRYRAYAILGSNRWARAQLADRDIEARPCPAGCSDCIRTCPRNLDIPRLMKESLSLLGG